MGARFTVTPIPECVARAGVEALARVTGVLVLAGLRLALVFEAGFRAMVRALPLPLRCDAFAFNCFPLFGLAPPKSRATRHLRLALLQNEIVTGRTDPSNPFFAGASSGLDLG